MTMKLAPGHSPDAAQAPEGESALVDLARFEGLVQLGQEMLASNKVGVASECMHPNGMS